MDVQPRQLVAYFRAGDLQSILKSRTIWICASCYACTVRCPAGIKVTELIYGLKRLALDRRLKSRSFPIYALSEEFVRLVNRYGRNQELELIARYFMRVAPHRLAALLPLGFRMLRAGRMPWRTHRVRDIAGLRRIIARAEAMEQAFPHETLVPVGEVGYGALAERAQAPAFAGGGAGS
jgi:heterodisulfide reductase subunit C